MVDVCWEDSETQRSVTLAVTSSEVNRSVVEEIREQRSSSAPSLVLSPRDIRPGKMKSVRRTETETETDLSREPLSLLLL